MPFKYATTPVHQHHPYEWYLDVRRVQDRGHSVILIPHVFHAQRAGAVRRTPRLSMTIQLSFLLLIRRRRRLRVSDNCHESFHSLIHHPIKN